MREQKSSQFKISVGWVSLSEYTHSFRFEEVFSMQVQRHFLPLQVELRLTIAANTAYQELLLMLKYEGRFLCS